MTDQRSELDRLIWITRQLRIHCPWTAQLTHRELTRYLVEEAYEAVEVIESQPAEAWPGQAGQQGTYEQLRKEMGDVLFQVVLHSAIAEDAREVTAGAGGFDINGVAAAINQKMIRRNPHVFAPDGALLPEDQLDQATVADVEIAWEQIKKAEKEAEREADGSGAEEDSAVTNVFNAPAGYPALAAAQSVISRAVRHPEHPGLQALAQPGEIDETVLGASDVSDEAALGEQLFRIVQQAHAKGLDAERALREYLQQLKTDLLG